MKLVRYWLDRLSDASCWRFRRTWKSGGVYVSDWMVRGMAKDLAERKWWMFHDDGVIEYQHEPESLETRKVSEVWL